MHLYLITRGIKHDVDRLINDLQAQYFPYKMNGVEYYVQLGVRPIQFWEMILPEDQMPVLLRTLWEDNPDKTTDGGIKIKSAKIALRKLLGAKKLPEFDYSKVFPRLVYNNNIGKIAIGVKNDNYDEENKRENL